MDSFDSMFDYNHDGELDREERVLQYEFLEDAERGYVNYANSKRRTEDSKLSDILTVLALVIMAFLCICYG